MNTPTLPAAPVRAVSLDLWGTLLTGNPAYRPERNRILHETFAPHLPLEKFVAALEVADAAGDRQAEKTGRNADWRVRVQATLTTLGVPVFNAHAFPTAHRALRTAAMANPPLPVRPDQPAAVAALAKRFPLAITCNTGMFPGVWLRKMLSKAGYPEFTVHTYSDAVRASKPNPVIYQATLDGLRLDHPHLAAADVLHLGDTVSTDVDGARAFGMSAMLVNTPDSPTLTEVCRLLTAQEGAR